MLILTLGTLGIDLARIFRNGYIWPTEPDVTTGYRASRVTRLSEFAKSFRESVARLHFFPASFENETGEESSDVARLHFSSKFQGRDW